MPPSAKLTGITLVFVATDEKDYLIDAVSSAFQNRPRRPLEIILVDNSSSDETADTVRKKWPNVKVLEQEERRGLYSNLNLGIGEASYGYVTICNCDIGFQEGALEGLAQLLDRRPQAGLVAPLLQSPDGLRRPSARRWYTWPVLLALKGPWRERVSGLRIVKRSVYEDWDHKEARKVDWAPCPAAMVRKTALEDIGPLDESFTVYFGDTDLCIRLHEKAWEVWCDPEAAVVHHEQRASKRILTRLWLWHLSSLIRFWVKHRGLRPKRRLASQPSISQAEDTAKADDVAKATGSAEQIESAGGGAQDLPQT